MCLGGKKTLARAPRGMTSRARAVPCGAWHGRASTGETILSATLSCSTLLPQSNPAPTTMTHQSHSSNTDSKDLPSIPGDARIDPEVPVSAKEAPLMGVEAAKETSFKDAVAGHAKYFAGKLTGNDKEVQQGAAR